MVLHHNLDEIKLLHLRTKKDKTVYENKIQKRIRGLKRRMAYFNNLK